MYLIELKQSISISNKIADLQHFVGIALLYNIWPTQVNSIPPFFVNHFRSRKELIRMPNSNIDLRKQFLDHVDYFPDPISIINPYFRLSIHLLKLHKQYHNILLNMFL